MRENSEKEGAHSIMPGKKRIFAAICLIIAAALAVSTVSMPHPQTAAANGQKVVPSPFKDDILLYIGSSAAYVRGEAAVIDERNPNVVPYIRNQRAFVPLRFIAEHFGTEVGWDPATSGITLRRDGTVIAMTVGDRTVRSGSGTITLDAAPEIVQDRTMVPLRAVAELLGEAVYWDDRGLIAVSNTHRFAAAIDPSDLRAAVNLFHTQLSALGIAASSDDGNVPANAVDGNLSTRWSANGKGEWLEIDLGGVREVGYAAIAFYRGTERTARFALTGSTDGRSWRTLYAGISSGASDGLQIFDFPDAKARYVRYVGEGNSKDAWNSVTEFQLYAPSKHGPAIARIPAKPAEEEDRPAYTRAGLYEPDGSPHPVHRPNPVTGRTINVLDYGADPENSGKDDRGAIQAAIDDASFGDEVFLPAGIYNLKSSAPGDRSAHLRLKSGVNLRGESEQDTVLLSAFGRGDNNSKVLLAEAKHDIVISNLTISSDYNGSFSSNHRRNNPERGGPKHGIYIVDHRGSPSYNITVDQVTVEKFESIGIRISGSRDIVVKNSTFRRATDVGGGGAGYGVAIQGMAKRDLTGKRNDTLHNLVENSVFEGPYLRHGVVIQYYAHNNAVKGSRFDRIALNAIDLHGEDEYLNEIYENRIFRSNNEAAIGVGNGGGEPPYNHDASGPYNYIHDNFIAESVEGIRVIYGSPDTVIEGNTITRASGSNARGIVVQNGPRTVIRGNEIRGNTARDFWAIHLLHDPGDPRAGRVGRGDPEDVVIEGNVISGSANGIRIETGRGIVLKDNVLRDIAGTGLDVASGVRFSGE